MPRNIRGFEVITEDGVMKVKQLIAALKKMPQQLEVNFRVQDHDYFEIDGDVLSVSLVVRADALVEGYLTLMQVECLNTRPYKWVSLG